MPRPHGPIPNPPEMTYGGRLYHCTDAFSNIPPHALQFDFLQRANLLHLENSLAIVMSKTLIAGVCDDTELQVLRDLLRDYTNAIRDFVYLKRLAGFSTGDCERRRRDVSFYFQECGYDQHNQFKPRYCDLSPGLDNSTDPLRDCLKAYLPASLTWTKEENLRRHKDFLAGQTPEVVSPFVDKLARFLVAFIGGASLLVPMLTMVFNQNQTKSLITTSVAVLLFSIAMSIGFRASNENTLAATATYAAVLVVFVGTSSSPTTQ